jgi:hypothetical protein
VKSSKLGIRFSELQSQLSALEETKHAAVLPMNQTPVERVDPNRLLEWRVKVRSLLSSACGEQSHHLSEFKKSERPQSFESNVTMLGRLKAVFFAAKEDYEGGYLSSVRSLVQAELFSDQLDQSRELLSAGYKAAAAVVAGVVLETTLRSLCQAKAIETGKLDKMNADLAKVGAYGKLVQKKITFWADIRNNAAHGHQDQFRELDVKDMIAGVGDFASENLA